MLRPLLCLCVSATSLISGDLASISNQEASRGLQQALVQGIASAIGKLSAQDGFLGNPRVKIPLPPTLEKSEKMFRKLGMSQYTDELVTTMNRAAESAVAEVKPILMDSLRKMTVKDAKAILTGPQDSATQYFRKTSGDAVYLRFLPKVQEATAKVRLAEVYDRFAGPAAKFNLIDKQDADLDPFVAHKAIDGLFLMIADEEKAIRTDPMGQANSLLKKVFGAL